MGKGLWWEEELAGGGFGVRGGEGGERTVSALGVRGPFWVHRSDIAAAVLHTSRPTAPQGAAAVQDQLASHFVRAHQRRPSAHDSSTSTSSLSHQSPILPYTQQHRPSFSLTACNAHQ